MLNYTLGTIEASEALIKDLYIGSKIHCIKESFLWIR